MREDKVYECRTWIAESRDDDDDKEEDGNISDNRSRALELNSP